jgi:hypothetical protein
MSVNTQFALILLLIALINFHYILFIDLVEILKANVLNFFHLFVKNNSKIYSFDESNTEIEKLIDFSSINAKRVCYAQHETIYEFFLERIWFWIDLSIYSLIPFAVMSISSFIIVVKFRKMNRSYFEFISKPTRQYNKRIYLKKVKKNRQLSLMLLNANIFFLIISCNIGFVFLFFVIKSSRVKYSKAIIRFRIYFFTQIMLLNF